MSGNLFDDENSFCYCHKDQYECEDDDFSCLDYMECEECSYYYEDTGDEYE